MSNSSKQADRTDANNHHANPPGNPVLQKDGAELEKARQKEFADVDNAKASQTAELSQHSNPTKHPIKQPNKATNNN